MPVITLKKTNCTCGRVIRKKTIDIIAFRKEMFTISESILKIWNGKKTCHLCKKLPEIDEAWGLSNNKGEKNRLFCPECALLVEEKLYAKTMEEI